MMIFIPALAFGVCLGLAVFLYFSLRQEREVSRRVKQKSKRKDLPLRERAGQDIGVLRALLRAAAAKLLPTRLVWLRQRLDYLDYSLKITAQEFVLFSVIFSLLTSTCLLFLLDSLSFWPLLLTLIAFILLPFGWLIEKARIKDGALLRELPHALDILAACTRAGLSFDAALSQLMENLGEGGLRLELEKLTLDLRMGEGRAKALRSLAERVRLPAIKSFTMAIIQGEKMGTAIGDLLDGQAENVRQREFQRLEKLAQQAPVKLLFPLVFFIFPVIFIVLFVPLAMQLISLIGG